MDCSASSLSTAGDNQEPTFRYCPEYHDTDGLDAFDTCELGGIVLDGWQARILDDWLARDASGRWAARSCALSVPRQNGKTFCTIGRVAYGALILGETTIYTSHLQKTSTETFEEMRDFFEQPAIAKYVSEIKTALGREQINLKNGARIKFLARTRNGGRGQHGALLIFDEAQELDDLQLSSFLPCISAQANPQTVYIGTPPDPESAGTVFERLRRNAQNGELVRGTWSEWAVDEIGDVTDQSRWVRTNPSCGTRMDLDTVSAEVSQMDPETFARERLGWWKPPAQKKDEFIIDAAAWDACATDHPLDPERTCYGVKFAADGSEVMLAVAESRGDVTHVELLERRPMSNGTAWLADWLCERTSVGCCVVVDGRSGSQALVERMSGRAPRGFVVTPSSGDVIAAASMLCDAVSERKLTWYSPQEQLRESAVTATRRAIGRGGGWGFGGADPLPIEACALALWGSRTTKRNPNRKARIG
jgi:hypothetical protein